MDVKNIILVLGCLVYCSKCTLAGYCKQSYTCTKQCATQYVSKTECGLFGWGFISSWGHCTTYRTKYRTCPSTCYKSVCCHGYTGTSCSDPLCHGSKYCSNGGSCVAPDQCSCPKGFSEPVCDDINECSYDNNGCQQECINTQGSYYCKCRNGYRLGMDQKSCHDVNECESNNGGCSHVCTNSESSHKCSCKVGFQLGRDGKTCVDINECSYDDNGCRQECINTQGSYNCRCRNGYRLGMDQKYCHDVNECESNNGGCSHVCTNGVASYKCSCKVGFKLGRDGKSCVDNDNCEYNPCQHNGTCIDGINTFTCICDPGYTDQLCQTDVDECQDKNGGCEDICTNTNGSHVCSCEGGRILDNNGFSCIEDDAESQSILHVLMPIIVAIVGIGIIVGAVYLWYIQCRLTPETREEEPADYENDDVAPKENVWDIRVWNEKYGSPCDKQ